MEQSKALDLSKFRKEKILKKQASNHARSVLQVSPTLELNPRLTGRSPSAEVPQFGAFRSDEFASRAEAARSEAMQVTPESLRFIPLSEAADKWWNHIKKPTVRKQRTVEAYALYLKNLKAEMGGFKLSEIHHGHLIAYQQKRHIEQKACTSYVNHETNVLQQIISYCGLWEYIKPHFKPMPPPDWRPPKTLTQDMEDKFFKIVAEGPESWKPAYWAVSITNNTSAMGTELRNLQRKHVFLEPGNARMHVPDGKTKNEFRARVIPLNEIAEKSIRQVISRAEQIAIKQGFAQLQPDHFLFPFRVKRNGYDVTRPATRAFIKKPFQQMREVLGPDFDWLQPRNFRNQIITKLFESGVPDETITAIAGHQSIRMSKYYSSIRFDAKKAALKAILAPKGKSGAA